MRIRAWSSDVCSSDLPPAPAEPAPEIAWKGAPEIKTADGWSFKPRGRMQVDVVGLDTPAGVTGARGGLATEFRRVYLGVDGKIPGGFSYRVEADFANNADRKSTRLNSSH